MTDESSRSPAPAGDHERGTWPAAKALLETLDLDPGFVERYEALASHPTTVLDDGTAALVELAAQAACTTVYEPEMRRSVGRALDAGASVEEVLGTLEFVSAIGVHAVTEGVPVLVDEAGLPEDVDDETRERRAELRKRFEAKRGYWDGLWEQVVEIDHDYFEAYLEFSAHPTEAELLTPLQREFVVIAADASTNHLYLPGLRIHIRKALDYSGTRKEIMAVIEIASAIGANTVSSGLPILVEEARERGLLE